MESLKIFWKNKKVIVTGHTGFKGSWLSIFLKYLGAEVYGISREKKIGVYSIVNIQNIFEKEIFLDIAHTDSSVLYSEIEDINPDIVFHFAAQSLVIESYINPLETLETNIIGSYRVLDCLNRLNKQISVIVSTTDKVYKNPNSDNTESSELGGKDFYSSSKVAVENLIFAYSNESINKDLVISTVRSGNVIGGGERADNRLITDIVSAAINNIDIHLRMPKSIRPWQHVLDSISGYILVAMDNYNTKKSQTFNLNSKPNNKYTAERITEIFLQKWKSNVNVVIDNDAKYEEVEVLKINSSKAKNILHWQPIYSLEKSLEEIVLWEKYYLNENDVNYSLEAVEKYLKKMFNC
jgi:CDP-glucose 4,6-dehydratase